MARERAEGLLLHDNGLNTKHSCLQEQATESSFAQVPISRRMLVLGTYILGNMVVTSQDDGELTTIPGLPTWPSFHRCHPCGGHRSCRSQTRSDLDRD